MILRVSHLYHQSTPSTGGPKASIWPLLIYSDQAREIQERSLKWSDWLEICHEGGYRYNLSPCRVSSWLLENEFFFVHTIYLNHQGPHSTKCSCRVVQPFWMKSHDLHRVFWLAKDIELVKTHLGLKLRYNSMNSCPLLLFNSTL